MKPRIAVAAPRESGAVLVVGLVLLVVLTLMGVSAINVSTLNLRNVANMQYRQQALNTAQQGVETILSNIDNFSTTTQTNQTLTVTTPNGSLSVLVRAPVCLQQAVAIGSQLQNTQQTGFAVKDTYWDYAATVNDTTTGAATTIHQGVMIPMVAGCQ